MADHSPTHVQVPGGEVVEYAAEAAAEVTDIVIADLPGTYDRLVVHNAPEQLVEGHTVFVTWDIPLIRNVTNWTLDILGDVRCEHNVSVEGPVGPFGVPIPNRINRAQVECHAGGEVFVTPDPFYDSNDTYSSSMEPTGVEIPFIAPNGVQGVAREYSYFSIREDATGLQTATQRYAWSVPIIEPWVHADGSIKRWYCPMPVARLQEMDITHFRGYVADSPDELLLTMN